MRYACANAHVDITPHTACALAGYSHRTGTWQRIESRLEANAVLLCDGKDRRVLFIAADILYFGAELVSVLEQYVEKFGIARDCLILTASHTHFAPATERDRPFLGTYSTTYNDFLKARLLQLIDSVMACPDQLVHLRAARIATGANINRRHAWPLPTITRHGFRRPGIVMAPEPSKPVDNFIDTLQFVDREGKLLCVAWKFACHPVAFPDTDHVSAEFPGHARNRLRQVFGSNLTVVFWQGFAGDVRPRLFGRRSWKDHIQALRRGPTFGKVGKETWLAWCDRLSAALLSAVQSADAQALDGELHTAAIEVPLSSLVRERSKHHTASRAMRVQKVAVGTDYSMLFFGAEVCSPYLQHFHAGPRRICVGYTGDVFGYLPSAIQAREGGYEGGEYLETFGFTGSLHAGLEAEVLTAIRELDVEPRPDQART